MILNRLTHSQDHSSISTRRQVDAVSAIASFFHHEPRDQRPGKTKQKRHHPPQVARMTLRPHARITDVRQHPDCTDSSTLRAVDDHRTTAFTATTFSYPSYTRTASP